ncbi:hypothetical protein [Myxacorys almedinensis]|uniref:DUF7734 domain-containing protein n=1 Tax=Myxacorys almedinensis A TaxID=2690445 RepID=A0A8J7Z5A9_9CYAN|nr:hypothetical protein [Myxacorys almedinensis]NDJ16693.1 hypothetical protein [Myxacorys almedinensis A]
MNTPIGDRLERYTIKRPNEVLLASVRVNGQPDQVAIFKGFSSSLMNPTSFDPDVPVLPDHAEIEAVDRLESPYNPNAPRYIEQGLSWDAFEPLLTAAGV